MKFIEVYGPKGSPSNVAHFIAVDTVASIKQVALGDGTYFLHLTTKRGTEHTTKTLSGMVLSNVLSGLGLLETPDD